MGHGHDMRIPALLLIPAMGLVGACHDRSRDAPADPPQTIAPTAAPFPAGPARAATPVPVPVPAPAPVAEPLVDTDGKTPQQVRGGGLLPLTRIFAIAQHRVPGEIIEVELDDDDGRPEYELEILTPDGRTIEMKIDARRGTILEIEDD